MTRTLLMVSPDHFGFNTETAESNAFQKNAESGDSRQKAIEEFNNTVKTIREKGIEVLVFPSPQNKNCPDAVFPNNWFSTHTDGTLIIYPMLTENRRNERNPEIITFLEKNYLVKNKIDLHHHENENKILEGTGSIVFDHENKLAYACISPRTNEKLLNEVCKHLGYDTVIFEAIGPAGEQIYHTNVIMAIGKKYVVICLETIESLLERNMVREKISISGKKIIEISFSQMMHFAGNMLEVENQNGKSFLILSDTAFQSLNNEQKNSIQEFAEFLPVSIPVIEKIGGGSARCMLAEIYLVKK